jgi:hypothetical protein
VNGTLQTRDRHHRGRNPRGQSRSARLVPGFVRLACRVEDLGRGAKTRKAAGVESGGRRKATELGSSLDGVSSFAVFGRGRRDHEAHRRFLWMVVSPIPVRLPILRLQFAVVPVRSVGFSYPGVIVRLLRVTPSVIVPMVNIVVPGTHGTASNDYRGCESSGENRFSDAKC